MSNRLNPSRGCALDVARYALSTVGAVFPAGGVDHNYWRAAQNLERTERSAIEATSDRRVLASTLESLVIKRRRLEDATDLLDAVAFYFCAALASVRDAMRGLRTAKCKQTSAFPGSGMRRAPARRDRKSMEANHSEQEEMEMPGSKCPKLSAIAAYASVFAIGVPLATYAQSQRPQQSQQSQAQSGQRSQSAQQEKKSQGLNPYARADDSWISLSGTVGDVKTDSFTLDYGDRTITVEMDDADRHAETYALRAGDKVTVNGAIDDDLFETSTIEASSVHVDKLGRTFFSSAIDEEDFVTVTYLVPVDGAVAVHGLVTEVNGGEFTIDNGVRSVRVDVGSLSYDPLDNEGYQKIEVGDVVRAQGRIDDDFWESRELMASSITTLAEEVG